ncbi:UNVERIFIED_CONTAM: hypothetical protein K2H54_058769 [Gekko kuhli]
MPADCGFPRPLLAPLTRNAPGGACLACPPPPPSKDPENKCLRLVRAPPLTGTLTRRLCGHHDATVNTRGQVAAAAPHPPPETVRALGLSPGPSVAVRACAPPLADQALAPPLQTHSDRRCSRRRPYSLMFAADVMDHLSALAGMRKMAMAASMVL